MEISLGNYIRTLRNFLNCNKPYHYGLYPGRLSKGEAYEKDRHQGYHFRKFLSRLKGANVLALVIPQCTYTTNKRGENEWHFHLSTKKEHEGTGTPKKATVIHKPVMRKDEILRLIQEESINVEMFPVRTDKVYTRSI